MKIIREEWNENENTNNNSENENEENTSGPCI